MKLDDQQILNDFQHESKGLIEKMDLLLQDCQGNPSLVQSLATYSEYAQNIHNNAKKLASQQKAYAETLTTISNYSSICEVVAFKASKIKNADSFYEICVALLMDGTEVLAWMFANKIQTKMDLKSQLSTTLIDRLRWVSSQFSADFSEPDVDIHQGENKKLSQNEIDLLIKKLGF